MKKGKGNSQDEILISIADLWYHLKKGKKIILLCAVLCAFYAYYKSITTPISYTAKATFRDKTSSQGSMGGSMQALLSTVTDGGGAAGSTLALMKSRKVLSSLVKNTGLQASLSEEKSQNSWGSIFHNIKVMGALKSGSSYPAGSGGTPVSTECILQDCDKGIVCTDIDYNSIFYTPFNIKFITDDTYTLTGIGSGDESIYKLGDKISGNGYSFRIVRTSDRALKGAKYAFNLLPVHTVCESLSKSISIERDKLDKNIIVVSYTSDDRHHATQVVNELLVCYKKYLEDENKSRIEDQIQYLENRRTESNKQLDKHMANHVQYLKNHISEDDGFIDLTQEISFISEQQSKILQRILKIQLELETLQGDNQEHYLHNEENQDSFGLYKELFKKRRDLQEQRDLLLISSVENGNERSSDSIQQWNNDSEVLKKARQDVIKIETLLQNLSKNKHFTYEDLKFLANIPHSKIWKQQLEALQSERMDQEWDQCKALVTSFLKNEKKLLNIQIDILQNRLIRQKDLDPGLCGLPLDNVDRLHKKFNISLEELQSKLLNFTLAESRLKDPSVEISSMSDFIKEDSIVVSTIAESTDILKRLHNVKNISAKETERLRAELDFRRAFLFEYISQTKESHAQEENSLRKKVKELSHTMLDLYQKQIAIISDQLEVYKQERILALNHEKESSQNEMKVLKEKVLKLPNKWLADKQMQLQTEQNSMLLEEVVRLVESTNISSNLARIEANTLDKAITPIFPNIPKTSMYTAGGGVIGAFLSAVIIVLLAAFKGVRTSEMNLTTLGQEVFGQLRSVLEADLPVARRIIAFISSSPKKEGGQIISLITGGRADPSSLLASLVSKKGEKALILNCSLLSIESRDIGGGGSLKDFLDGKTNEPFIQKLTSGYDYIYGGAYNAFAVEEMSSKRFLSYLSALKNRYDWIFMVLPVGPLSSEAEHLKELGDKIVVAVHEERIHDIRPYLEEETSQHKIGFILT